MVLVAFLFELYWNNKIVYLLALSILYSNPPTSYSDIFVLTSGTHLRRGFIIETLVA